MFEAYLLSVLEIMNLLGIKFSFSNILDCLNFDLIQAEFLALRDEKELSTEQFDRFNILFSELENNWEDSKASVTKLEIFKRGKGKEIFEETVKVGSMCLVSMKITRFYWCLLMK